MRLALTIALLCGAAASAAPGNEAAEGWVMLGDADWGKLVFADFALRFEMKATAGGSGALYVRGARDGKPDETGYAIQLGPGNPAWPSGSVIGHARANAGVQPPGQWLPFEVEANGTELTVRVFDRTVATAKGLLGQAGLIEISRGSGIEVRNVRVKPLGGRLLFNGADLTGWKSTGTQPKPGGMLSKVFGKKKPKEAHWTVANGMIHGDSGPGQLESASLYGDFILQTVLRMPKRRAALLIRGDAGQLGTGYEISVQPAATGGIAALAPPRAAVGVANEFVTLTVSAENRHFEVWTDGVPVAIADDVRPEGPDPRKAARTTPGVIAFLLPDDGPELAIRSIRLVDLPKTLGHTTPKPGSPTITAGAAAPAAPPPIAAPAIPGAPSPTPSGGGSNPQLEALQQQMQQQQQAKAQEDQKQQKVSALLQQALKSKSPDEQLSFYDQILALDPNNQVAFNARKDAQAQIDARSAKAAQEAEAEQKKTAEQTQKQQQFAGSVQNAEAAFLGGDLKGSEQALSAAEKIAPGDPAVQALRKRLDAARGRRDSMLALAGAGLLAVVIAGLALLVRGRGKKAPYLEVVAGLDKGKKYTIDQEVLHLGAIAEDGGQKNEVVLRDAERMVSRFHAQILNQQGRLFVVDVGSANGTFVDKNRVPARQPYRLRNGSRVNFGGTCIVKIGYEKRSQGKTDSPASRGQAQ